MIPSIEVWVLTFHVLYGAPFVGGEYQTERQCHTHAAMQEPWWRKQYGRRLVRFECKQERL